MVGIHTIYLTCCWGIRVICFTYCLHKTIDDLNDAVSRMAIN